MLRKKMTTIITAPAGASPAEVEMAVKWVAEALYQVGALSIRAARLAAGRTQQIPVSRSVPRCYGPVCSGSVCDGAGR